MSELVGEQSGLDALIPDPGLRELDLVELAASPAAVWERVRHGDLACSPLVRMLFFLRTLPDRWKSGERQMGGLRVDAMISTPERPGFAILCDAPPHEVCVGAIGQLWRARIPFLHPPDAAAFAAFAEPGQAKVAWALRVSPLAEGRTRLSVEVRVAATDEGSWRRFRRYFRWIGPGSRYIRRSTLRALARELG
jgi:hypothetical protein